MNDELPPGWAWATIEDLISQAGIFSDGDWVESKDQDPGGDVRLVQLADVGTGAFRDRSQRSLTSGKAVELNCTYLEPGDVLVARMPDPLGRACQFPRALGACVTVVDVAIVRLGKCSADPTWLMWSINSPQFNRDVEALQSGTTRKRISRKNLATIGLSLPPLAEQKRIVAAIEEHFSRLGFAEAALDIARAKLQALRRSVLAAAFSGRLANPPPTTNTDPGQLPGGWRLAPIADVAEVHLGRQRSPRHHSGEQMRPYLRAANVTWEGISLEDVKTMNFDDADFDRFRLTRGDILLNEASGSPNEVGKPAVWDGEIEDCCFQNTLLRLRPRDLNGDYLYWYCYSSALSGRFGEASRGVNIRHLGKRGLAQFPIPLGPRAEQEHVVAAIEESLSRLDAAETALDAVRAKISGFRRSVLLEALAGRLVPQDPDDEPAIALLARIAAERPVRPTSRKGST